MVAFVINDDLEGIWKEEVEAKPTYYTVTSTEELGKIMKNLAEHIESPSAIQQVISELKTGALTVTQSIQSCSLFTVNCRISTGSEALTAQCWVPEAAGVVVVDCAGVVFFLLISS
jgi:hypothetical protein